MAFWVVNPEVLTKKGTGKPFQKVVTLRIKGRLASGTSKPDILSVFRYRIKQNSRI